MEEIDPEWSSFEQRQQFAQASESAAWDAAAGAEERAALHHAISVLKDYEKDDADLVGASVNLAAVSPPAFQAFLEAVEAEYDDPEYAQQVGQAVVDTLGRISEQQGEIEFQQNWAAGNEINVVDAAEALDDLMKGRNMSPEDVQKMSEHWQQATGQPLRTALEATLPWDRPELLREVAIQTEVDDQAERMRQFKLSLFTADSTDISDGLKVAGGIPKDLPPSITDPSYNRYLVEQRVRQQDEERERQPQRETADDIRRSIIEPDSRDWREGLTTAEGRPTSVREIAERDPDSVLNQQERQRQRQAMKLANSTGARRV
jgi:hypothetical protein